jgi:hypothetical protein
MMHTDPSGHVVCEVGEPCGPGATYASAAQITVALKKRISEKFGVTLDDGGAEHPKFKNSSGRYWDENNVALMYAGLSRINKILGGRLKTIIGSATFTINSHPTAGKILGWTSGTKVDFYTNSTVQLQNLYHEFGHVLDNSPGFVDVFSGALGRLKDPGFIDDDGYLDTDALINTRVHDPNNGTAQAIQHKDTRSTEQWADIFANYVAGNINLAEAEGKAMYNFITGALTTDVRGPVR